MEVRLTMSTFGSIDALTGYIPLPSSPFTEETTNNDFEKQAQQKQDNDEEEITDEQVSEQESSISKILTSIEGRFIEIFKDQFNKFYVTIRINNHTECIPFESERFKNIIRSEYYVNEKQILTVDRLDGIIKLIESKSECNEDIKKVDLNLRVAKINNDVIYYDLTNQKWDIIKITSEGWDIVKNNEIPIFKRYENNCSSQIYPSKDFDRECFSKFLKLFNLDSKNDILLLSVYIISLFIPEIPKVILVISGTGGGAKTTTFRIIKNIVDPGIADTLSFPKQFNDLVQTLAHHYVNFFDNVSSISEDISDLLCRAVTGAGFNKRALYQDDTDFIYKFKRCIGINGINLATTRADFLDRSLVIKLKRIEEKDRRKEDDIDREMEELRPSVLGYIFDILVKALKYRKDHQSEKILKGYPRMADYAEWCEIISRCIGYKNDEFIDAYHENINNQNDEVIESSPIAEALLLFIREKEEKREVYWEGTPTRLLKELTDIIDQIKPELKRSNLWPKACNKLTSRINEILPNLKEKDLEIIRGEKNIQGDRVIKIRKLQKEKIDSIEIKDNDENEKLFNPHIHRVGDSDTFDCERCTQRGDIHYMKQHNCLHKN
jgi:hypothetical protein